MALKIYWTKRADKKFDQILNYLYEEWGENIAKAFIKKVYEFIDILSEFPEIGTLENREKGIRGFTITKQVNIFYRISGDKVILLTFFDNRQHPKKKRF
jgi:plasmid stabilization system protein ParE